jgi:exodeoxyribonuclease VII small subunit
VTQPVPSKEQEINFEASFHRLEEILEKMNTGTISLDEALKLYEEADKLITLCAKRLNDAERTVEILIKNRQTGELVLGNDKKPATQDFSVP